MKKFRRLWNWLMVEIDDYKDWKEYKKRFENL